MSDGLQTEDLYIKQGTDYSRQWTVYDSLAPDANALMDLTGASVRAQVRSTVDSTIVLAEWTSAGDGGFTIDAVHATIVLIIPAAESSAWGWRDAVYDILLEDGSGSVSLLVQGTIKINPVVTR